MPTSRYTPRTPSIAEQAKEKAAEDIETAEEQAKNPEVEGKEPENLVVVEDKKAYPIGDYSHPLLRLNEERLQKMNAPEIRAVGLDRGYFGRGDHSLHKTALVSKFLEAQEKDQSLHDDPTITHSSSEEI